jgi:hypothetical protein
MASPAALAIVIAAPAFAAQRGKPTQQSAFAGAFASSVNPGGTHLNLVQRPANHNLNANHKPALCLDFDISLDLPTGCWGHGL